VGRFALEPYKKEDHLVSTKIGSEVVKEPTDLSESENGE
jgi:hypothetical protein